MLRPTAYKIRLSPSLVGLRTWGLLPPRSAGGFHQSPVTNHQSRSALHKRRDPRDALTDHQLMNVVRPLVGRHAFEIIHVTHDAVIVHDAVRAENIPRLAGRFQ